MASVSKRRVGFGQVRPSPLDAVQQALADLKKREQMDAQGLPTGDHDPLYMITPRVWQLSNNPQVRYAGNFSALVMTTSDFQNMVGGRGPRPALRPTMF